MRNFKKQISHKSYYIIQYEHPGGACSGWIIDITEESQVSEGKTAFTFPEISSDGLEKYSLHTQNHYARTH